MRTQNTPEQKGISQTAPLAETFSLSSRISYRELDLIPVRDVNLLEQIQANLETLKDMQLRMNFMMREIRYLMKV